MTAPRKELTPADFLRIVTGGAVSRGVVWPDLVTPLGTIAHFWVDGQRVAVWLHQ